MNIRILLAFVVLRGKCALIDSFSSNWIYSRAKCCRFSTISLFATKRRQFLSDVFRSTAIIPFFVPILPSDAGEIGAKINRAVTTSDVGISVRRSVVRGAQTMDQIDKQWELFSDKFGLGSARYKQGTRPKAKYIPPLLPLDVPVATQILVICDEVFCEVTKISANNLQRAIDKTQTLVKPSFQRAGVSFDSVTDQITFETAPQFDFASYVHFRAYSNLLISNEVNFRTFQSLFEEKCGKRLLGLFQLQLTASNSSQDESGKTIGNSPTLEGIIKQNLQAVQGLTSTLRDKGLVAASEISPLDSVQLADWVEDSSDLQLTLALDGDAAMKAQILLQEQGYRLVPNYAKFMIRQLLSNQLPKDQTLTMEEYYMDTNYNSDPSLYDAQEVLLNVVLERR